MIEDQLREEIAVLREQLELLQRQREHEYYEKGPSFYQMVRKFHEATGLEVRETPIDLDSESEMEKQHELIHLRWELINEEFKELMLALITGDLVEIADAICDLHYVLSGTSVSFGIPEDACFAEVQRSNMSKLGPNGEVLRREDGKILKHKNWSPPDLRKVIYGESRTT